MRSVSVNDLVKHNGGVCQVLFVNYSNITIKNVKTSEIKTVSQGSLDRL